MINKIHMHNNIALSKKFKEKIESFSLLSFKKQKKIVILKNNQWIVLVV